MKEYKCRSAASARSVAGIRYVLTCALAMFSMVGRGEFAFVGNPADDYIRITRQLRREVLASANSPHGPAAIVAMVGRDPEKLADAIVEWIAWEPELGVVRGPSGTLSAGAGGDWDRAVLLRAVLNSAGYPARLVIAERDQRVRREAVDAFLAADAAPRIAVSGRAEPLDESIVSGLLARYGIPVRNRTILMSESAARWNRLIDEAYDSGERHADLIVGRLAEPQSGPPASFNFNAWREDLMKAASEAVAVEVLTPDGWSLLLLGPGDERIDWPRAQRFEIVPDDRKASLAIILEMNVARPDNADEQVVLLEHSMELANMFKRPVRLEISAQDIGDGPGRAGAWGADEWFERATAFKRFQAALQVGPEWYSSLVFDMTGETFAVGFDGRIDAAAGIGRGVGAVWGGMFGAPPEKEPAGRLDSLVLTIEINQPGKPLVRQRRLIYGDLRPGVIPAWHADILVSGGPISPASATWLTLDTITANAGFTAQLIRAKDLSEYPDDAPARMPQMLYEWNMARLALADRQLRRDQGLTFVSGPTVSMWTTQIILDPEVEEVFARTALDVVWDGLNIGPREAAGTHNSIRANVSLGVASTAFESMLLRELTPPGTIRTALAEAELFFPRDEPPGEPAELARWGIEHNEAGRTVLLAGGEKPNSWWSIDPTTCATIGRGDAGEGQTATEFGVIQKQNLKNLKCVLQGLGEEATMQSFAMCMVGVGDNPGKMGYGGKWVGGFGFAKQGAMIGYMSDALSAVSTIHDAMEMMGGEE